MSRAISFRLTQGAGEARVVVVDDIIEDTIRRAIVRNEAGAFLTLAPAAARDIRDAVAQALAPLPADVPRVFLTKPDVRHFLRQLIKVDMPHAVVISYADLLPSVRLVPVARVSVGRGA
jgi:type III secretory pathway component EscV